MSDSSTEIFNYLNVADGASSTGAANSIAPLSFRQDEEVTQPHGNENKQKPKAGQNPSRQKQVIPKYKPPQFLEPTEFIGVVISKKYKRARYVGSVVDYNADKKWFRVEYEDGGSEDMLMDELLNNLATFGHLGCPPRSKKTRKMKKKPATRKKRDADVPYIPLALRETRKDAFLYYNR